MNKSKVTKRLEVIFLEEGTILQGNLTQVFMGTIAKIGVEKVSTLNYTYCKRPLITEKRPDAAFKEIAPGKYINTWGFVEVKAKCLREIIERLDLPIEVSIYCEKKPSSKEGEKEVQASHKEQLCVTFQDGTFYHGNYSQVSLSVVKKLGAKTVEALEIEATNGFPLISKTKPNGNYHEIEPGYYLNNQSSIPAKMWVLKEISYRLNLNLDIFKSKDEDPQPREKKIAKVSKKECPSEVKPALRLPEPPKYKVEFPDGSILEKMYAKHILISFLKHVGYQRVYELGIKYPEDGKLIVFKAEDERSSKASHLGEGFYVNANRGHKGCLKYIYKIARVLQIPIVVNGRELKLSK